MSAVEKSTQYFNSTGKFFKLYAELQEWEGTPYQHYTKVKKRGVDCAMLLVEVFKALGIVKQKFTLNYYPADWHVHKTDKWNNYFIRKFADLEKSLGENYFFAQFAQVEESELVIGDWLTFCLCPTEQVNHSAIYCGDGNIFHAINRGGTKYEKFSKYKDRHRGVYRVMEKI